MFGFNVNKFIAEITNSGVAHPYRYEVVFSPTRSGEVLFDRTIQEKLNTRLESISLPGSDIGSTAVKLQGIDREIPYGRIYEGDMKMVFIEDSDFTIRKTFESWQKKVIDDETYHLSYYDDCVCESMDVTMTNLQEEDVYSVRIFSLFPKTIGAIELSGAGGDSIVKTEIDLSYRRWVSNPNERSDVTQLDFGTFFDPTRLA